MISIHRITDTTEYRDISSFYRSRKTVRSQIPLINHIDEGLFVLSEEAATLASMKAFCLHPIFQSDEDLADNYRTLSSYSPQVVMLVMEYRNIANAFLSDKISENILQIFSEKNLEDFPAELLPKLSPIKEVNDMLIADKVQNRKDFDRYHKSSHARSNELSCYFHLWLRSLSVSETRYNQLISNL